MKYLHGFDIFEKLNNIDKLFESFDVDEFKKFYNEIDKIVQGKRHININISNEIISKITDFTDDNLVTIQDGRHIKKIKPSKLIEEKDSTELEKVINIFKSFKNKDKLKFELLSGDGCQKYFYQKDKNNRDSQSHFLKFDCMQYEMSQKWFDLLEKNPDVFSVLYVFREDILTNNGLAGFVILIKVDGKNRYDRIYGYNIEDAVLIERECINRGYINVFEGYDDMVKKGEKFEIKLKNYIFDHYPYMDTFKYLDINNGTLLNYNPNDSKYHKGIFTLNSTNGLIRYNVDSLYYKDPDWIFDELKNVKDFINKKINK